MPEDLKSPDAIAQERYPNDGRDRRIAAAAIKADRQYLAEIVDHIRRSGGKDDDLRLLAGQLLYGVPS